MINLSSPQPDIGLKRTDYPVSPLIAYTLRGLRSCWMPESGRWSHIYHLDGRPEPNECLPWSDVFYSLNVLLGFSRIAHLEPDHGFDLPKIFQETVSLVPKVNSRKYVYGMALWAAAALELEIPEETFAAIRSVVEGRQHWKKFLAQDIGMILTGCVEHAKRTASSRWAATAHDLFAFLCEHYSCASGLFFNAATGGRRAFSSFATHTYLTLACYIYGEWSGNEHALTLAKECTRKLIELQGPQGEWPWFYYTPGGRVMDFYEIYSVHQQGMAPAFLECAERHLVPGATEALVKGFQWILGENQMGRSMLWKREGLICRSQVRKGDLECKWKRAVRSVAKAITGESARMIDPSELELRLECRSYELGWILWSFGSRTDLTEIVCHSDFC
jgi:hypothetical protein